MRIARLVTLVLAFTVDQVHAQDVYFGNLHSHTSYSDGSGRPRQAYRYARFTAGLDFLAITEHNHKGAENSAGDRRDGLLIATDPSLYVDLIHEADKATEAGKFVAIYGQEVSSIGKGNHMNVFDVQKVVRFKNGEFDELLQWLHDNPVPSGKPTLAQFNHPALLDDDSIEYGRDDFSTAEEWVKQIDHHVQLLEILNGPATKRDGGHRAAEVAEEDFFDYLHLGFHVAPTGDQDNHYFTWGTTTDVRTGVLAEELTRSAILKALRARHAYASEDKNLRVVIRVNGHLLGDRISSPPDAGTELAISISIKDDDEPDADYTIQLYSGKTRTERAVMVEQATIGGDTGAPNTELFDGIRYGGGHEYFFFKIIQHAEHGPNDRVWTAPIWFEPAGELLPPVPDNIPVDDAVARTSSGVFHFRRDCRFYKMPEGSRVEQHEAVRGRRACKLCERLSNG